MSKIDWARKLGSRKFWAMVADFVMGLYVYIGGSSDRATQLAGIICAFGGVVAYILAEAITDAAYAGKHEEIEE